MNTSTFSELHEACCGCVGHLKDILANALHLKLENGGQIDKRTLVAS
ncbi:MAG: hypothetical protein V4508_22745 [Pseudomonadota bacterium]